MQVFRNVVSNDEVANRFGLAQIIKTLLVIAAAVLISSRNTSSIGGIVPQLSPVFKLIDQPPQPKPAPRHSHPYKGTVHVACTQVANAYGTAADGGGCGEEHAVQRVGVVPSSIESSKQRVLAARNVTCYCMVCQTLNSARGRVVGG